MRLAHRVKANGKQLDDVDERIIIKGIDGGAGKDSVTAVATGRGDGTRITGKRRESLDVQVKFSMNIRRNLIEERAEVLEAVNAWALGGIGKTMEINYKPGRQLHIDEVTLPGEGDLWKRLSEYTLTFRARAIPYWEETEGSTAATGTTASGSGSIEIGGSAETVAECELENRSGKEIPTASITIGGNTISFADLGLGAGETLVIDHAVTKGKNVIRLRIRTASGSYRSALNRRTAESADEFYVLPGTRSFSFTADRACRLTVTARGRFA